MTNYKDYSIVLRIPSDDPHLINAWNDGDAVLAFESFLQKTTEWVDNNEYRISVFYFKNNTPVVIYQNQWVGGDQLVSNISSIPPDAQNCDIYITYESVLGTAFFLKNGNDVRFKNNHLYFK